MSYTDEVYARVVAQNPGEPEFHQAVKEEVIEVPNHAALAAAERKGVSADDPYDTREDDDDGGLDEDGDHTFLSEQSAVEYGKTWDHKEHKHRSDDDPNVAGTDGVVRTGRRRDGGRTHEQHHRR